MARYPDYEAIRYEECKLYCMVDTERQFEKMYSRMRSKIGIVFRMVWATYPGKASSRPIPKNRIFEAAQILKDAGARDIRIQVKATETTYLPFTGSTVDSPKKEEPKVEV